ncbi:SIS domain-containing protein [Streptomyces albireticuli]|uniref:SIS domain-containing protein n=1 Tax=Streptomyces albireticuli TaxID=1940 RepID=UPI001E54D179|nr:sugar isomerase [Streptomyces albireticuli]MCD9142990.1 sugar isomerase [Streptomyces albireticuli]MCD9165233.1 sugar isomerase [Streptomyces albireticuli]MCD9192251.1 sugar isomerase [Streptomyces albireticuli]
MSDIPASATSSGRTSAEILTQPSHWLRAAAAAAAAPGLPRPGERVAVTGCGTSWFMAQAYAALREAAGQGETDAFAASEFPVSRTYDRVVAITRSGTTTEVLDLIGEVRERWEVLAVTATPGAPVVPAADEAVVLDFADEESVVQTRFATSALAFLRAGLERHGRWTATRPVAEAAKDAESTTVSPLPPAALAAEQWTFLGTGWTYGLAQEAALKMREAAGAWTEAYPAMEYRHGPVSVTGPGRVTWIFGEVPAGLAEEVTATGGTLITSEGRDPMADLIRAQRLAVAVAEGRGLDPDRPRNLTRSVILNSARPAFEATARSAERGPGGGAPGYGKGRVGDKAPRGGTDNAQHQVD